MSKKHYDVIIVGAGMAGAALACALSRSSLSIALVDNGAVCSDAPAKSTSFADLDPRVVALTEASQQFLQDLDVWSDIESAGLSPYEKMHVWDAEGTGSISFDCHSVNAKSLGVITESRVITWALHKSLCFSGVAIYDELAVDVLSLGDVSHRLRLSDGSELTADLLIGADGGNSLVRKAANINVHQVDNRQQAIVCNIKTALPHNRVARQRFLKSGPLAFLPISAVDEYTNSIVWSCDTAIAEKYISMGDEAFTDCLAQAFEIELGGIESVSRRFVFPLIARHAQSYVAKGLALIGDAAHVVHPLAGQGINLGFEDVEVLSKHLKHDLARGLPIGHVKTLAKYQRERKGDNLKMIAATQSLKYLFGFNDLSIRWLRNVGMRFVDGQPVLKNAIINQAMGL